MSVELVKYREALSKDELSFLRNKEGKELKQFFKIVRVFMVLCFVCPFIIAWFRAVEGMENPFSLAYYFMGVTFLACFSGAGIYWGYYHNLRKVQKDISSGTKTIERTYITRKQYIPSNNSFYLYLTSSIKLSIEVNELDFRRLENGDEVNIEYTTFSKLYLGYF